MLTLKTKKYEYASAGKVSVGVTKNEGYKTESGQNDILHSLCQTEMDKIWKNDSTRKLS